MQYSTFYAKLIPNGATAGTTYNISVTGITAILGGAKTYDGTNPIYFSIKPKSSGTATVTFKNDTTGDVIGTKTILVRSTSRANPTYGLTSSTNSVNEGGTVTFTLDTSDIGAGSTFAYTATGITAADLDTGSLTGNFTIGSDGTGTISFKLKADNLTEGTETLTVTVSSANNVSKSVTVNDTSTTPVPTYALTSSANSVDEGNSVTFTLTTTNVANGTTVAYDITGISLADLSSGSLSGNFTVQNNTATRVVSIASDAVTEGVETMTFTLTGKGISKSVTVNDTSTAPVYSATNIFYSFDGETNAGTTFNINNPPNYLVARMLGQDISLHEVTISGSRGTLDLGADGVWQDMPPGEGFGTMINGLEYLVVPLSNNVNSMPVGTYNWRIDTWYLNAGVNYSTGTCSITRDESYVDIITVTKSKNTWFLDDDWVEESGYVTTPITAPHGALLSQHYTHSAANSTGNGSLSTDRVKIGAFEGMIKQLCWWFCVDSDIDDGGLGYPGIGPNAITGPDYGSIILEAVTGSFPSTFKITIDTITSTFTHKGNGTYISNDSLGGSSDYWAGNMTGGSATIALKTKMMYGPSSYNVKFTT